jgi:hypothetical protein
MGMGGFGSFGSLMGGAGAAGSGSGASSEWSEEDVIHNTVPALFDNLLTVSSSEHVMSLLTAPYLRIPLLLSFFANKDRVDLLASRSLQRLLVAALFECGPWASRMHEEDVSMVPLPASSASSSSAAAPSPAASAGGGSEPAGNQTRLGSPSGLLLNELSHAAGATLNPFLQLLSHALALDTGHFSASSATCKLLLFASRMAARMESFVRYTLRLIDAGAVRSSSALNTCALRQAHLDLLALLHGPLLSALLAYKNQSLSVISEAVWVMSCVALVAASGLDLPEYLRSLSPSPWLAATLSACPRRFDAAAAASSAGASPSSMVELLGSFSFVLTWHSMGIGIGKDLAEDEKEGLLNRPSLGEGASGMDLMSQFGEMMQASMSRSKLKAARKDDPAEREKASKPPVPEVELFQAWQRVRPRVLAWADAQGQGILQQVFDELVEWVHGHKMGENGDEQAASAAATDAHFNPHSAGKKPAQSRSASATGWKAMHPPGVGGGESSPRPIPGRFVSQEQRLEIDLQTASITFYDHDVFPVHDLVRGSTTQALSL